MRIKVLIRVLCVLCVLCGGAISASADAPTLKPQFKWPSTQPIGIWHLSDPSFVTPANPSGWNLANGPQWPGAYLDAAIPILKSINAQGVIIWDIEGSSLGANFQYVGSPDLAPAMNPTMDYDALFARLRKQKIIPGLCLRPINIANGKLASDPDPYANLSRKIAFARAMWRCRIFYIDSNVREPAQMPAVQNGWVEGPLIPATVFARLHQKFPDCLLIPEHKDANYHLWSIPYREALLADMQGGPQLGTPDYILRDIPAARSALFLDRLSPEQLKENWPALKSSNCIFLLNAWWPDPDIQMFLQCNKAVQ